MNGGMLGLLLNRLYSLQQAYEDNLENVPFWYNAFWCLMPPRTRCLRKKERSDPCDAYRPCIAAYGT
jgi:hypothetical protein